MTEKLIRDNFPMPLIDNVLQRLQSATFYSTLDLRNGFFHVPLETTSRKYTAFVTHNGQYEFLYAPFGISNSPAVFTRYVNAVLGELIRNNTIIAYMDDIIIPSKSVEEGLTSLRRVLETAELYGLRIKWEKCQFLKSRVTFLGYVVEASTIAPSREKTIAVGDFPIPTDKKMLQRFLGLTSYFRRFIPRYSLVAKPLTDLMGQYVEFQIGDEQIAAFQQLKTALANPPLLRLFDPTLQTEVHTDASMFGYGGVLLQKDSEDRCLHPIEYMSRKTTVVEQKYHSYELEVLAIIAALKKWRVYVMGIKFRIVTDCNAFALTMKKEDVPLRVSRWAMFLQDYQYEIEHRSGSQMRHVDALSRIHCLMMTDTLRHRIREEQLKDDKLAAVRKVLEHEEYHDFYLKHGVLHKDLAKELMVVPTSMEREVIQMAHRQGHYAAKKTQDLVERDFFIYDLAPKVVRVVRSCVECLVSEAKAGKKEGMLHPIRKEDRPLVTYHLDHVGPMEETKKRYNYILVVVDAFSKFVWLYPTRSTGSDEVLERLERQAATFGHPLRIITDRGTGFTSNAFEDYCKKENIQHLVITTGVPRGNGQVERVHKIVIPMLTKLCVENPKLWYKHVDRVQQVINSTPSRSTKYSPFKLLTGVDIRVNENHDIRKLLEESAIEELEEERSKVREEARANISHMQEENIRNFNKNRRIETEYVVGDLVAVKRTQYGTGLKLKPKFYGPYKVKEKRNHGRYTVEKIGDIEGPRVTHTVAEYMKPWNPSFEANETSGWPNVGLTDEQRT